MFIVDAQLPPSLARFLESEFGEQAVHVEDVGLRHAKDSEIAAYAREHDAIVISKDEDYLGMARRAELPGLVFLTCGNVSNERLPAIVSGAFHRAVALLAAGEPVVEIHDESSLA